jgi:hypothetical protein
MRFRDPCRGADAHAFNQEIYDSRRLFEWRFEPAEWPIRNVGKSFAAGIAAVTLAATIKETKVYARRFALRTNHIHQPPMNIIHEPSGFYSWQGNLPPTEQRDRQISRPQ